MTSKCLLALFSMFVGTMVMGQDQLEETKSRLLEVEVIDIVERTPVWNFDLVIQNEIETVTIHVDSTDTDPIELKYTGKYQCTLIKEGYDTLKVDWETSGDSESAFLEFFVPKPKMTHREKRTAHKTLDYVDALAPTIPNPHEGGFKRLGPRRNQMCVIRFKTKNHQGTKTSGLCEFRKLRFY